MYRDQFDTLRNSQKKKMFLKHQRMFYRSLLADVIIICYKHCDLSFNIKIISMCILHGYFVIELLTVCHTVLL